MVNTDYKPFLVAKEDVTFLEFPKSDVLISKDKRSAREKELRKALLLGNGEHFKVKILFVDVEGYKTVETTIWGLTDSRVILKKGVTLPISRIIHVEFV